MVFPLGPFDQLCWSLVWTLCLNLGFFLYCRREYIRLGSEQDPTWRDFPQSLAEMGGARRYITLFEAPFQASVLLDYESNALRASSLMVIPPLHPGTQPLAGSTAPDLLGYNLTQWASEVQEVTSHMRWPPEAAVRCPLTDIIRVLDRLEGLARRPYCRSCFGIGPGCQCLAVPRQVSGPMAALWTLPKLSYLAMVSSTKTTASTSAPGVAPPSHLPPKGPAMEHMDTLLPLTSENLLATAGVGWGCLPWAPSHVPTAPGLRQTRPVAPRQQAPTSEQQEMRPATPYRQQVFPPRNPAPKSSAAPSTSQDQEDLAEGARGRSLSRGPLKERRRSQSSTRGSQKCRQADPTNSLLDRMANFKPSGWKRDLTHIIGTCWEAQVGSLERDEWQVAITKFLKVMARKRTSEWLDIREVTPLQFMPYVAKLFREVTGQNLTGLGQFTRWIGLGGYYHWRVAQQGLIHLVPHLVGAPKPRKPDACPSGKPLPKKPARTETPSTGASGGRSGGAQSAPGESGQAPASSKDTRPTTSGQSGSKAQATPGGPSKVPPGQAGQVMVLELTGMTCTCARPRIGSQNLQCLRIQLEQRKQGEKLSGTSTAEWLGRCHPSTTSLLGPYRPTF